MRARDERGRTAVGRSAQMAERHRQHGRTRDRSPASVITSRDNKWLKMFRAALRGSGPARDEPIGVEGTRLVREGLRSGLGTEALLVSESGECDLAKILESASETEAGIPRERILRTTDRLFSGVAGTDTPQGVAALFREPVWGLE